MGNISINEFVKRFEAGEFEDPSRSVQCDAGWYDWFCRDTSLRNKTRFLGRKVVQLSESKLIDSEQSYVFFKNNCPVDGHLYDSFSICDLKTGDVQYWICPSSGFKNFHSGKAMITDFTKGRVEHVFDSWREVRKFFGV